MAGLICYHLIIKKKRKTRFKHQPLCDINRALPSEEAGSKQAIPLSLSAWIVLTLDQICWQLGKISNGWTFPTRTVFFYCLPPPMPKPNHPTTNVTQVNRRMTDCLRSSLRSSLSFVIYSLCLKRV